MTQWTLESFKDWKASHQTKAFLAFLKERRFRLQEQWAKGNLPPDQWPQRQEECRLLMELENLEWEQVSNFYGLPDET